MRSRSGFAWLQFLVRGPAEHLQPSGADCQVHGYPGLYVVDGSVMPTSLGVNPQETIYGIARWVAQHIGAAV